jgi:hypothetical protein
MGQQAGRRRGPMTTFAVAAGFIAVVGMAGLSVSQGIRASNAQNRVDRMTQFAALAGRSDSSRVPLQSATLDSAPAPLVEVSAPGERIVDLYGVNVPAPAPGMVYRVWLEAGGSFTLAATFLPEKGFPTVVPIEIDANVVRVVITEESEDAPADAPAPADVRWSSAA